MARAGVAAGEEVLDVACGTGNAAIRAAQAGGRVVGLDLTPELLDSGRRLAAEAGVAVDWVEGDVEALPFPDESFDVVLSTFGCMFAPRHEVTARELARVLRPGGRLALSCWTPAGAVGRLFAGMERHAPASASFSPSSTLWGSEEHVRALFAGTGVELEFERAALDEPDEEEGTIDEAVEFYSTKFGPLVAARALTEAEGRWPALRAELVAFFESEDPAEYLVVLGRKG